LLLVVAEVADHKHQVISRVEEAEAVESVLDLYQLLKAHTQLLWELAKQLAAHKDAAEILLLQVLISPQ
jgi:hypothetical protein